MPIDYTKRRPAAPQPSAAPSQAPPQAGPGAGRGGSAIGLDRLGAAAPGLVNLYKQAAVSLEKHGVAGERAAVYLVLDHSSSMRGYYRDGSVQHLAEQVLGLSAHFDDDGTVPLVFFSTGVDAVDEIALTGYQGRVEAIHQSLRRMGGTNYCAAMEAVVDHHRRSGAAAPAFVVFQTDGSPGGRKATTRMVCDFARFPVFWQFVGFGRDRFRYLDELVRTPVGPFRMVDNTGFFPVGADPRSMPDGELYDRLMGGFPRWLAEARRLGIVRT